MTSNPNDASQSTTETDAAITAILAGPGRPGAGEAAAPAVAADRSTVPAPPPAPAPAPASPTVAPQAQPTVRWGALVWALLFGMTAATTLWVLVDPARREVVGDWLITLSPLTATLTAVIIVGVVVALFGIVGLIRRGERARR